MRLSELQKLEQAEEQERKKRKRQERRDLARLRARKSRGKRLRAYSDAAEQNRKRRDAYNRSKHLSLEQFYSPQGKPTIATKPTKSRRRSKHRQWWKRTRAKLIANATPQERTLQAWLLEAGIRHRFQHHWRTYFADFYLPDNRATLELDGSHHREQAEDDAARDKAFATAGYSVLRIWNWHATEQNRPSILKAIAKLKPGEMVRFSP